MQLVHCQSRCSPRPSGHTSRAPPTKWNSARRSATVAAERPQEARRRADQRGDGSSTSSTPSNRVGTPGPNQVLVEAPPPSPRPQPRAPPAAASVPRSLAGPPGGSTAGAGAGSAAGVAAGTGSAGGAPGSGSLVGSATTPSATALINAAAD